MPIYEFKCLDCKKEFETLVLGRDEDISCPYCHGNRLEHLISKCTFKGNGGVVSTGGSSGCSSCSGTNCSSCH